VKIGEMDEEQVEKKGLVLERETQDRRNGG
jgi:hypothetical protein